MIRGETRAKTTCFACVSCLLLHLLRSPAVGKVSKPRRGHPLVEFVIVVWIVRKQVVTVGDWKIRAYLCMHMAN